MIQEFLSTSYASYLISQMALIPIILLYFVLRVDSTNPNFIHRIHKSIVGLTYAIPVMLVSFTFWQNTNRASLKASWNTPSEPAGYVESVPHLVAQLPVVPSGEMDSYPLISDLIFYFADLVTLFSILGLMVFAIRWVLQLYTRRQYIRSGQVDTFANNIKLVTSDSVAVPFVVGIWDHQIFIPAGMDEESREIVIAHEQNHIKHNHQYWSFAESFLRHLFWFNPIVFLLSKRGILLRELECDKATIKQVDKFAYSKALLSSAEKIANYNQHMMAHSWVDKKILKKRIDYILGKLNPKTSMITKVALAFGVVVAVSTVVAIGNVNDELLETELLSRINAETQQLANQRPLVDMKAVPSHLIKCLLIHQDQGFYDHQGVSSRGIARALFHNFGSLTTGGKFLILGGSTMTQQLAKSFLSNKEKTLNRKLKELKIAHVLEVNFSKQQLIEMYLNRAYFGSGAWGLVEASKKYFNREYHMLTLNESAMLVPFLDAPDKYNLIKNKQLAVNRQNNLLERLGGGS